MTDRKFQACLISLTAEVFFLGWMSQHGDFPQFGEASKFTLLGLGAGVCYCLGVHNFVRLARTPRQEAGLFWGAALALRMAILPVMAGDDIWRYRWEGQIQLHGYNPYQFAPDSPVLIHLRDFDWKNINHRDFATIYPPIAQLVFAALAGCGAPVLGYKLFFGSVDLMGVAVLRRLLTRHGVSPDAAAWYAWNPLAVYVSAGAAHFDSLMVLPLLGAIYLLDRFTSSVQGPNKLPRLSSTAACGSALLLGAAVAVKIVPVVLLPVWVLVLGWWRAFVTLPIALAVMFVPACYYGFPRVPVFTRLRSFTLNFRVNDAAWWLLDTVRGTDTIAQVNSIEAVAPLLTCGCLAIWFRHDWRRSVLWVMGAALLLSPEFHAWYLVWLLPLAAWHGPTARPWFLLSISMFGYFLLWDVNYGRGIPWREPLWLRLLIYLPPFGLLIFQHLRRTRAAGALRAETW